MDYSVKKDVPRVLLRNEDTAKFLGIIQYGVESLYSHAEQFKRINDYRYAEEQFLDAMLFEAGWSLKVSLTVYQKRKILKTVRSIHKWKGNIDKIIYVIKEILGKIVAIEYGLQPDGTFILGDMSLGEPDKSTLGYGGIDFHFLVHSPILNADELTMMTRIIDYMRWAVNTFEIIQDLTGA